MDERLKEIEEAIRSGIILGSKVHEWLRWQHDTIKRLTEERDLYLKQNKLLTRNNVDYRDEVARLKVENARLQDALTIAGKRIDSYQD